MVIKFVEYNHPHLLSLAEQLDAFFYARYGEATLKYSWYHDMSKLACAAVAYLEDKPIGCCCWKPMDAATAEIKRMFVQPECRRRGVAMQLIAQIEAHAAASGCHRAVLETGADMDGAIAAYERMGYQRCTGFGDFVNDTGVVCMEKEIFDGTMR